ncbi:hypothetical protein C8Q76DRAFT_689105 [Earliella scabrosa]|nr:hypothetical protein C8Q76DRAFT_689105 [Earliella scabrosa]
MHQETVSASDKEVFDNIFKAEHDSRGKLRKRDLERALKSVGFDLVPPTSGSHYQGGPASPEALEKYGGKRFTVSSHDANIAPAVRDRVRELPQWLLKQLLAITRLPMPKELTVPGLLPSIGGVIIVLLRSSPLKRVTIPCHKYRGGPKSRVLNADRGAPPALKEEDDPPGHYSPLLQAFEDIGFQIISPKSGSY